MHVGTHEKRGEETKPFDDWVDVTTWHGIYDWWHAATWKLKVFIRKRTVEVTSKHAGNMVNSANPGEYWSHRAAGTALRYGVVRRRAALH